MNIVPPNLLPQAPFCCHHLLQLELQQQLPHHPSALLPQDPCIPLLSCTPLPQQMHMLECMAQSWAFSWPNQPLAKTHLWRFKPYSTTLEKFSPSLPTSRPRWASDDHTHHHPLPHTIRHCHTMGQPPLQFHKRGGRQYGTTGRVPHHSSI